MPFTNQMIDRVFAMFKDKQEEDDKDIDVTQTLSKVIEKMTGIEPDIDSTLEEVGLASVGIPVIVGMLNSTFSTKKNPLSITNADLVEAKTIEDMVSFVETAIARMKQDGV